MTWFWGIWIAVTIIAFGVGEAYALKHNVPTLSRTVWNITAAWPPFAVVYGLVLGGLAIHFFWPGQGCVIGK
jgi:hypothetical protein